MSGQAATVWMITVPSETVYSIVGRLHRRLGYVKAASTSQRIFGSNIAFQDIHSSDGLASFVSFTRASFGSVSEVLEWRTVLGTWLRFSKTSRSRLAIDMGLNEAPGRRVPFARGMFDPSERYWLKFCPACAKADENHIGEGVWRSEHQFPGMSFCVAHECRLHWVSTRMATTWLRPPESCPHSRPLRATGPQGETFLLRLASILNLLHSHATAVPEVLRPIAVSALCDSGVLSARRGIHADDLEKWWTQQPRMEVTGRTGRWLSRHDWLIRVLTAREEDLLRWAVLLSAIGDAVWLRTALSKYAIQQGIEGEWIPVGASRGLQMPEHVVARVESGEPIKAVAESANLQVPAIRHWLRLNPQVKQRRERASRETQIVERRARLQGFLGKGASRAELMRRAAADFRWLSKHDPEWLSGQLRAQETGRYRQASFDFG